MVTTLKIKMAAFLLPLVMCTMVNIQTAQAQNVWGAVAFNARGATGVVWNRYSRWRAERDAMRICTRNATIPCKVLTGANYACGAISNGRRGSYKRAYAVIRSNLWAARQAAMNRCISNGNFGCYIRNVMCADGRHRQ